MELNIKQTQSKIQGTVEDYIKLFPEEYKQFKKGIIQKRENMTKNAQIKGDMGRHLHDVPETLFNSLLTKLDLNEFNYWGSKEGSRWFAKTFPDFAVSKE